ncbi:Ig-like domain-containing protein [Leifsonia sp. Leaf264]|uniref:Ig-like domain-containing protein n=1 Tax=Leifsonia sp. Leaf264 TaxID=1736314 RepID=UPI000AD8D1F6|nr:Ig-like domain-containing protein [Leifsonia sp. Leaf264]
MRAWLSTHRSGIVAMVSGTAITTVIATIAIASGGYSAQRIDLGDGSVWVTNSAENAIGRANTQILQLDSVVAAGSKDIDVIQSGSTVLVVDQSKSAIAVVDAATSEVTASIPLPSNDPEVSIAGDTAVIVADGDIWTTPLTSLGEYDPSSEPRLRLGPGTVTSVDPGGRMIAFTPATSTLSVIDVGAGTVVQSLILSGIAPDDDVTVSSVAGSWAVLDRTTRVISLQSGTVALDGLIADGLDAQLQQASVDGSDVLVAHQGGLVSVPISSGAARSLESGRAGTPSAPVVAAGCRYAAWADGKAWSACGSKRGVTRTLDEASGGLTLTFRENDGILVLNDTASGDVWAVQDDNHRIDNWAQLIDRRPADKTTEKNDPEVDPEYEKSQLPPVAKDDEFGARPGRPTTLPVLINDFDPNGDVLVVESTTQPAADAGRVDVVGNGQQLQLTLPDSASGTLTFRYTVSDGRGLSDQAEVTVTVRTETENSPPQQVRDTRAAVQVGGRVTTQVLTDWYDPDGDAIFLSGAVGASDQIAFKPDGTVIFSDVDGGGENVRVSLAVSDGRDTGSGALVVKVRPAGSVPIIADPFVVSAYVGEAVTVTPLAHVHGGSGSIRLSSVPAKPGADIVPDYDAGTFQFTAKAPGTVYVDYGVTDGVVPGSGVVRIDVSPLGGSMVPITVPHTAFVRALSDATIDVLASDIDPSGGVLLLTGVSDVPPDSGMRVEVLEQRLLRITLTRPLEENTAFSYTVSNGTAEAAGRVTVIEVPQPAIRQAPIANPDTASVRVGDAIDIPVLANDEQPDGDPLTLDPELPDRPEGSGLAFASGQTLRYLAPDKPGNYTAVYRVDAPDGQFASGEVRISVRETDPTSNRAPVPRLVTARVLAGDTVRITIPLAGIDPDGDSVQLLGQESNPDLGAVTDSGSDWLEYTSGEYSEGTDSFTYSVVDALGSRATGTIRVGISARLDGARNPIAVPDVVAARPGSTVLVQVLENDSDPDGGALAVTGIVPTADSGATATIEDDVVTVQVPDAPGEYGFVYTIQNPRGGTNSTFLTVQARTDAPLSHPVARDTVLTLSDVLDRDSIDVDVLANVFFADGPAQELKLSLLPDYETTAVVTASKRVRVTIEDSSQIIPFRVAHPEDPTVVAYALIWVPGFDDALPQLRRSAPAIMVASEADVSIDINDFIVAVGNRKVRLTDSGTVRATHSDGSDLVVDRDTLRFRSAQGYFGPASISFEVTDAPAGDDDGRVSTIVLPITVTPRENQPPSFTGGIIEFEPGQEKDIRLTGLTSYPYPDDIDELSYSIVDPPVGFSTTLDGRTLTIRADADTATGSESAVTIGVRDDVNTGSSGRIVLRVVPSTRPIAVPAPDSAIAPRGQTTTIDVLKNDNATNPFPETPLRVLTVTGVDSAELPDGVTVEPSADKSIVRVTVSDSAAPVDTNLQYQVADATGDPTRYAWGTVRISVQDRPDPVTALRVTGFGDGSLSVAFNAAGFNNSPISGYDVALVSAATGAVVSSTPCAATTCTVATPGNGEANAVRVRVTATNGIGVSDPTETPAAAWSDVIPPAPTGLTAAPLDGGLKLGWDAVGVPGGGTAVATYVVTVGGTELGELSASAICSAGRCSIDQGSLVNGSTVAFTVSARNGAYPALSSWNSASGSGVPFGAPVAASVDVVADPGSGAVTVQWAPFAANGDPLQAYYVQRLADTAPGGALPDVPTGAAGCSVSTPAPGTVSPPGGIVQTLPTDATTARFDGLTGDDTSYNFVVWGYNRAGCVSTVVDGSVVRPGPGAITAVDASVEATEYAQDLVIRGVSAGSGVSSFQIRLVDQAGSPLTAAQDFPGQGIPRRIFGRSYGETLRFQVRGCTAWGSCGPWSDVQPGDPQPSLTWELPSRVYTPSDPENGVTDSVWSWTNDPGNGPDYPASYTCYVDGSDPLVSVSVEPGGTSCTIPDLPADAPVRLGVTINGVTRTYSR